METVFPWLVPTFQQLITYKENGKVPHGILLSGSEGLGKTTLALQYAKFLLCEQLQDTACDQCRSCQLFSVGNHPDFARISCEEGSQVIKIDQVRQLVEFVAQTSALNSYQVVIINPANMMNKAANNALLKTLEEPRGNVVIILVTHLLSSIPSTIRSRCHVFKVAPPSVLQAKTWLMEQSESIQNLETFLAIADNLPQNALILAREKSLAFRDLLLEQLLKLANKTQDPVIAAEQVLSLDLKILLSFWINLIMDMIRISFHSQVHDLSNRDQYANLLVLSQKKSLAQLFSYLDKLYEVVKSLNDRLNLNTNLLLEKLFIYWYADHDNS